MKFSAAAVLSAAVAVSASPVATRSDAVFEVTNFQAGCIPHSSQCRYAFGVVQAGNGETTPVECVALVTSNGQLPGAADLPCTNSSRTFSIIQNSLGLTLLVSQPVTPSTSLTGQHLLPKSDLVTATQPNAQVQSYTGPTSFSLEPFTSS